MAEWGAIVLAAGQGKRMHSPVAKQFLLLDGRPVLYYSLKAFEESGAKRIILVTGENEIEYCRREIVEKVRLPEGFGYCCRRRGTVSFRAEWPARIFTVLFAGGSGFDP